uniref:Uncharacterized protein n=1 Tax=Anguilla anguilla TaxID=7936 RepID=A0A0E9R6W9_ANGAN
MALGKEVFYNQLCGNCRLWNNARVAPREDSLIVNSQIYINSLQ